MVFEAPGCYVFCAVVKIQVMKGTYMMVTNILTFCDTGHQVDFGQVFFYYPLVSYYENKQPILGATSILLYFILYIACET